MTAPTKANARRAPGGSQTAEQQAQTYPTTTPRLIDAFLSLTRFEARRQADLLLAHVVREASPSVVADALVEFAENLPDDYSPNDLLDALGWTIADLIPGLRSDALEELADELEEEIKVRAFIRQQRALAAVAR